MDVKEKITEYLKYLKSSGRAERTVQGRYYDLNRFMAFLEQEKISTIHGLTKDLMAGYQEELAYRLTDKGMPLSIRTQAHMMSVVKGFTRYLKDQEYLLHDPCDGIHLPRKPKRLPKTILSLKEVKYLMETPDTRTNQGYRDRLILEILYDTAIRRNELASIKLTDMDIEAGFIHIHGKGSKDRIVPLSKRVCELAGNYILIVRPALLKGKDDGYLILNRWGNRMDGNSIWYLIKKYSKSLDRNVSPHTLRHTCATHMLRNGAPVRHLQEMLGHESLESTQIYTRVTISDLKKIHSKYHPSESLNDGIK